MESIQVSDLVQKLPSKEDKINFFKEQGAGPVLIIGLLFPDLRGFDAKFFFQVLAGEKNVTPGPVIF